MNELDINKGEDHTSFYTRHGLRTIAVYSAQVCHLFSPTTEGRLY